MKLKSTVLLTAMAVILPLAAQAQNVAIVNGKAVPKSRVTTLLDQVTRNGQPVTPDLEKRAKDEVVLREIFAQAAEKQGVPATADFKAQLELLRQTVLIRQLFADYQKKHQPTDTEIQAEYDKAKAAASGTEYHARHILVESEDEANKLIAQLKGGANFEDLAKKFSKDPGSAEKGGDLDFAKPDAYVPEFGKALASLKKGEITQTPVKTQFGYHIIKLEDTRQAEFPALADVKAQIVQRLAQEKLEQYQDQLRKSAKTDYKFEEDK